jgi:hypothetical protein
MSLANNIKVKGVYLGYFTFVEGIDSSGEMMMRMKFNTNLTRKELLAMGDVVYGMYINDQLVKIGKAGGAGGFYNRAGTYCNPNPNERTNKKIRSEIAKRFAFEHVQIEIYGQSIPRIKNSYFDNITEEVIEIYAPQIGAIETKWTARAEIEGEDLYLSTQKK